MSTGIDFRKLPPLKALRGFEAATRLQSIRDAADELCLTHPAISHQVQLVEAALGVRLFAQDGRHIVSTEEGRLLYPYVRAAFESLLDGVEAVRRHTLDTPLRVQTYVTASIRWLAPRVPRFAAQHPDIRLTLRTCAADWHFDEAHADLGLIYAAAPPDPERFFWQPLFDYALVPVCTPELATGVAGDPAALARLPLIANYTEVLHWRHWFETCGLAFADDAPCLMVDTLAVALELALAGHGVALANPAFVARELATGALVMPVAHAAPCPGGWGLICRQSVKDKPPVRLFREWLAGEAEVQRLGTTS